VGGNFILGTQADQTVERQQLDIRANRPTVRQGGK
jgi:hypothetical protein